MAERLALVPNLLGIQAQMIRVSEHLLEEVAGSVQTFGIGGTSARQSLHQPKRAEIESALGAFQAVGGLFDVVAKDQSIGDQTAILGRPIDSVQGAEHARI